MRGNPQPVQARANGWDLIKPGDKVADAALIDDKIPPVRLVPGFGCEVDAYCNLVLRAQ